MSRTDGIDQALYSLAARLGPLRSRVVFVGGAVRGLFITDPGGPEARPTDDIDVIVGVSDYGQFHEFERLLHARGFSNDTSAGAPLCRFRHGALVVDVMPTHPAALGFTNRWYEHGLETANVVLLGGDPPLEIRVITASCFVATKLEAFAGRGQGNVEHHDIEDYVAVVDGRDSLLDELIAESAELRDFVAESTRGLFELGLGEKLCWHLPGDAAGTARLPLLETKLKRLQRLPEITRTAAVGHVMEVRWDHVPARRRRATGQYVLVDLRGQDISDAEIEGAILEDESGHRASIDTAATLDARAHPPARDQKPVGLAAVAVFDVPRDATGFHLILPSRGLEFRLASRRSP